MRAFAVLALSVMVLGCARESRRELIAEDEMQRIREDLAIGACQARLDSLGFEIDGLIYRAGAYEDGIPVLELLPDTLPACPLTGEEYLVTETSMDVTVTCPSGHGSRTVLK